MSLLAVGLNYKNTPLAMRERAVITEVAEALRDLRSNTGVQEAVILSTCNRTEVYCASDHPATEAVSSWLSGYHGDGSQLRQYLYGYPDEKAVRHVMRVASGLDSMVLGEPQVLGQLKTAWREAGDAGTMGQLLDRLLQHSFATAKEVRSNTSIGHSPVSIATIGVRLARQLFSDLQQSDAMLIGAGEMVDITARHLHRSGIGKLIFANRSIDKAQQLASKYHGYAIELASLERHLVEVDLVVSCTAKPDYVISRRALDAALAKRMHRPMFLIDLAVPRDIDPGVSECRDAYLYTIDDLREISEQNLGSRRDAIEQAEDIVNLRAMDFMSWLNGREHTDTIRSLHSEAWHIRQTLNQEALLRLSRGGDPGEVLEKITRELTGRLLHEATTRLRHGKGQRSGRGRKG